VSPLRLRHAARGDVGGADGSRPPGQGALPRLQRVAAGSNPGRARPSQRELRLEPAPVLAPLARSRA
jgi:hypothetical protein